MKTLIILLALTAGITTYAQDSGVSPQWQVQPEPNINWSLNREQFRPSDPNNYERQRAMDLARECEFRRSQDESAHGNGIVDRAIGNRIRENLISNGRDATDGFDSVTRNDGSRYVARRNPCEGIYTPDSDPDGDNTPGMRFSGRPLKGGAEVNVTIKH